MLHLDLPTAAELVDLATRRTDLAVSLFLPTTPSSLEADADRSRLKQLATQTLDRLAATGADPLRISALGEELDDLIDDHAFWRLRAHGLAIYATPDHLRTFRVPHALPPLVEVSDRFYLKPLLRAVAACNACYVLALADGAVRLIEVSADLPAGEVTVIGMPKDLASGVEQAHRADPAHSGRPGGGEGQKVQLRQYARSVDSALRGLLAGSDVPLVLAANAALGAIYRSVNTYPHLAAEGLASAPEWQTEGELATAARAVLQGIYRNQIAKWTALFKQRSAQRRATSDLAEVARAATHGAVQTLLADLNQVVYGTLDEGDGTLTRAAGPGPGTCDLVDEIARRVLLSGGQVLGVQPADLPAGQPVAAILRYAI